jgi:hypothetical protein
MVLEKLPREANKPVFVGVVGVGCGLHDAINLAQAFVLARKIFTLRENIFRTQKHPRYEVG